MKESIEDVYNWLDTANPEFGTKVKLELSLDLIHEELSELREALSNNNKDEIIDAVSDLFWVIHNVTYYYGINPNEITDHLNKVKTSNFSKFCQSIGDAELTVKAYKDGTHKNKPGQCIDTYYKATGSRLHPYVVLRKSDDKILKSIFYVDVSDLK